jgi:hypothetical protein
LNGKPIAEGAGVKTRVTIMLVGALCGAVAGILTKLWLAG